MRPKKGIHSLFESQSVTMSDSDSEDQPTTLIKHEGAPERQGSVKRRKPGLKGLAMQMKKLKTFSAVASDAAIANSKPSYKPYLFKRKRKLRYLSPDTCYCISYTSITFV